MLPETSVTLTLELPQSLYLVSPGDVTSMRRAVGDGDLLTSLDVYHGSDGHLSAGADEEPAVGCAAVRDEGECGENPAARGRGHVSSVREEYSDPSQYFL